MLIDAGAASGPYWSFVLEILHDKQQIGRSLSNRDRYWAMRAYLAKANTQHRPNSVAEQHPREVISKATAEYIKIGHIWDSEIHIPYFEALLSWSPSMHLPEIVHRLCTILEADPKPYPQCLDFLWKLVLKYHSDIGPGDQTRILSMVATRISGTKIVSANNHEERHWAPVSISQLVSAIVSAIFPTHRTGVSYSLRQWAYEICLLAFAPSLPALDRWRNLVLISIYQASQLSTSSNVQSLPAPESPQAIEWHTPCYETGGQAITRPLWKTWKNKADGGSAFATRPIVSAFFKVAADTVDKPLVDACFRYCTEQGLWTPGRKGSVQSRDLVFSYILASVACRRGHWAEIFSGLRAHLIMPGWEREALEDLIRYYTFKSPTVALELYHFGNAQGITVPANTTHMLSVALASSPETIDSAIAFLKHSSRYRLESLLTAFLRNLHNQQYQRTSPIIAASLAKTMFRLYRTRPPPLDLKYPIRYFFPVLIASGQAKQSVDILQAIHATSPEFFSARYLLRLMRIYSVTVTLSLRRAFRGSQAGPHPRREATFGGT
ncbi:hypothetical protein BD779DRAFT_1668339 [Infundibulicybe gibba]|nr:hypothetical protein BD779DRAFT_1668339 [Infundibulicybe gibba]